MDPAKSHLGEEVKRAFVDQNSDVEIIHGGMTPLLQFQDTHVNKPFKDRMRDEWEAWIEGTEVEYTASGNRKRASYQLVAEWADKIWKEVATDDVILQGFRECGYIEYNNDVSKLHSRLKETLESREVPQEVITEMNEFIEEMRAAELAEEIEEDEVAETYASGVDDSDTEELMENEEDDDEMEIIIDVEI